MEPTQEQPTQGLDLYWSIAKRRRWWLLFPFVVGWAAVLGASWVIPAKYKSESTILLEPQRVSTEYVTPNVTMDIGARLNALTETIMSRPALVGIADKFNLYGNERSKLDADRVVEKLRKDIDIEQVRS